ncbi:MAG: hypothetical protein AB8H47_30620 [Bacteroidia bacterium]
MNNEKEKWIDEVVESMKGSQRAEPRSGLFAEIQGQITAIPIYNWKNYAAAAALIILLNTAVLVLYTRNDKASISEAESISLYNEPINISFQIYN